MKVRGDIESVNLSTGEQSYRVTGDGESILVKSRGPVDEVRLGPKQEIVFGPRECEPTPEEIVDWVQKLLNERKFAVHYKNGRQAKNGDKVVLIPQYGPPMIGILYDATAGNDYCNGRIAPIASNDPSPNLKECLHLDDVLKSLPTEVPDTSVQK